MAHANLVSRRLKVLIGADSQDWSFSQVSIVLGYDSIDETGLIKVTGQIEIQPDLLNPESIDPRINVIRWRPGQPVRLQIADSTGSFVDHPLGHLQILKEPPPLQRGGSLTLDVGCWLAWMDAQGPDGDQSGVDFGTSTNTATVAQALLEADDIPAASINLGSWTYSIAVPAAKEGGSYTGVAGELAYSNDFRYLYVDKAGVVRSRQLLFATGVPVVTITLGENDSEYSPLGNPASPAEVYRVDGAGTEVSPLANPITDQNVEVGDAAMLGPGQAGSYQVTTNYTDSYVYNPTAVTRTSQVQVLAPPELVYLDPAGVIGNTQSYLVTETKTYDASLKPHRLLSIVKTIQRPQGAFNLNASPKTSDRTLTTITTTFTYTDDVVSKVVVIQDDLEILHHETSANPYNPQTVRKQTRTWTPQGNGEFKYNEANQIAAILNNSATDTTQTNLWALMIAPPSAPSAGGRGENAPPATEYWEGPFVETEKQYSGQATFTHPGGSSGRTRTAPITVPFGFSNAQCAAMAALHRDLAVGEYRGMSIKLPITDALIAADFPLFQIDVIDGGTTYSYLANGVSWEHTPNESAVYCQGLWLTGGYA